jgi:hypothetical protein
LPNLDEVIAMARKKRSRDKYRTPSEAHMQPTADTRFQRPDGLNLSLPQILERIDGPCVSRSSLCRRLDRFRAYHNRLPTADEMVRMATSDKSKPGPRSAQTSYVQPTTDPRFLNLFGEIISMALLVSRVDGACVTVKTLTKRVDYFRRTHDRLPTSDEVVRMITTRPLNTGPRKTSRPYMQPTTDPRFLTEEGGIISLSSVVSRIEGPCVSANCLLKRVKQFPKIHKRLPTSDEVIRMARKRSPPFKKRRFSSLKGRDQMKGSEFLHLSRTITV